MTLIREQSHTSNSAHRGTVPAGQTGVFTFPVSRGKRVHLNVAAPVGGSFRTVGYLFREKDDAEDGMTRVLAVFDDNAGANYTAAFNASSIMSMAEVGIEVMTPNSEDLIVEIIESNV